MALYNPESSTSASTSKSGDEIDLREYVQVLVDWWREIVLFTVMIIVATGAYLFYQRENTPVRFQASATVVVARVISDVDLATGVRTQVDAGAAAAQGGAPRRATLVALVRNGQIAEAVLNELGHMEGMEKLTPTQLMRMVSATSVTDTNQPGDLIEIQVVSDLPELSAAIANAWATYYVRHVNAIYGQMPDEIFLALEEQLAEAETEYEYAQTALEDFVATNSLPSLQRQISDRQMMIGTLHETQELVLSNVISETVGQRVTTIATYLNAQSSNRLLAFRREQEGNRTLLNDLITIEIENRRMALRTEQEMRRLLFEQYAQAELDNRLLALEAEQAGKTLIFETLSQAEAEAMVAVYNERFNDRIATLMTQYDQKRRFEQLLADTRSLQAQIEQSNGAGLQSSSIAVALLKAHAYAASSQLPANLQLNIPELDATAATSQELAADLAALASSLETRIDDLEHAVAAQSESIFSGDDYQALAGTRDPDDALYTLVQETYLDLFELGDLASTNVEIEASELSAAIARQYDSLFQTGSLVAASLALGNHELDLHALAQVIVESDNLTNNPATDSSVENSSVENSSVENSPTENSPATEDATGNGSTAANPETDNHPEDGTGETRHNINRGNPGISAEQLLGESNSIQAAVESQYPNLFELGNLTQMIETLGVDTELDTLTMAQIEDLLQLRGLEDIPGYLALTEPTQAMVADLDREIRALEAQVENVTARREQLTRNRDRAVSVYDTLSNKLVELELQRAAANREVSIGAFALAPDMPMRQDSLWIAVFAAAAVSLVMAIFMAFVAHLLGIRPPLARLLRRGQPV